MILSAGMPACARALELAAGDDIGAGPELGERLDHRLVGIRLHGVADQRVHIGEGAGEHVVVARQRRGRIAVERRADGIRDRIEAHALGVEHAVAIVEVVHRIRALVKQDVERDRFLLPARRLRPAGGAEPGAAAWWRARGRSASRRPGSTGRVCAAGGGLGAAALGGRSSGPLRPQAASASAKAPIAARRSR